MKKHTSKLIALVLALCLCLSLSVSAFAAEIDSSGGSGSTPVNLSSTSDGTEGGDPSATAMRVTVPTALPMAMSQDGDVTTANNCQIVNHSYGAVRVKSVSITAASGWKLTAFGNKSILAGEKVDSNKLGFAISIGGGQQKATDASNANTQTLIDAPIAGCYMTGVGDSTGNTVKIDYAAMFKAAADGTFDFVSQVKEYGRRAEKLKKIFTDHGFTIVYDHDLDQPIADGFYFTIGYPGMTGGQLMEELVYYGVSAISLSTTGSNQQGLRACTSFIKDHQYDLLDERLRLFEENHQA